MKAFRVYRKVKLHWFDEKYGEKQWSLMTLATHPDYGRGGVGTALCYWAIQRAISDKIEALTLFASPLGKLLYTKLKFIVVGIVRIQVEGEEEFVDLPGMTLELKGRDRSEFRLPKTFVFNQGSLGEKIICTLAQTCFD
jgi:ribosomal protein S18 acetylase RimI-like enzyme